MLGTAGEVMMNLWTPTQTLVLANQQGLTSIWCGLWMQSRGPARSDER